jgi:membrane protease YdiL (CAAX protease family)
VRSWRHVGLGVLGAFGLVTAAQGLAFALGASTFDAAEAASRAAGFLGGAWAPDAVLVPLYVILASVAFTLPMAVFALGEELGWSGVLVPNLARRWPYPVTSALFGVAWFLFHLPLVLFAHYALNAPLWYAVPAALLSMVLMAFPLTYLRLASGSIWPGVVFHGMLNAAGVYVYGELLSEAAGPLGVFLRGEGGLAALTVGVVVAALLTRRAARENRLQARTA